MDTDKVIQDLNRRFAAPLPEFYQRCIIFWYGEDNLKIEKTIWNKKGTGKHEGSTQPMAGKDIRLSVE